jgi:regulator of cell morphogenesis and NO signaling
MIPQLQQCLAELAGDLTGHMLKEERVLFPYVVALEKGAVKESPFGTVANPIAMMEAEHDEAGRLLAEMNRLTGGYRLPEGACNTFRALFHGLSELEREMHLHVHLENNILFPRAVGMERNLS